MSKQAVGALGVFMKWFWKKRKRNVINCKVCAARREKARLAAIRHRARAKIVDLSDVKSVTVSDVQLTIPGYKPGSNTEE